MDIMVLTESAFLELSLRESGFQWVSLEDHWYVESSNWK